MREMLYPFLQGERRLQGPIWSAEGKAVPTDEERRRALFLETISRTKKKQKNKRKR